MGAMSRGRSSALASVLLMVVALLGACSTATAPSPANTPGSLGATPNKSIASGRDSTSDTRLAPTRPTSTLDTIRVAQLPSQAVTTLEQIAAGGPFPYSKDGATFGNREGLLPKRKSGFYQEYTVITPGSSDRGAKRIVAGDDGTRYWTTDHYDSFREVIQP